MSEIQENNTQETQNPNIDTQVTNEGAPVQAEAPQEQNIGAQEQSPFEAPEPPAQEEGPNPAEDIADPAVTMSSEDLVGSDPKVTMNPEDLSGPETAQEPGIFFDSVDGDEDGIDSFHAPGIGGIPEENLENPPDFPLEDGIDWGPFSWGFSDSDVPDPATTTGTVVDPVPAEQAEPPDSHTPGDQEADLGEEDGEPTPGGYDGSGIAGGLDLDENGVFDRIENNPETSGKDYTYDEGAYEDAQDAFEDLQDALQDGDEEDRAEAIEELRDYLNGFDKDNEQEEEYTYDEEAYEDAEDAFEDLQHALKHGDEEERAEALEELQGYLGGFDKGGAEEDQDGTEKTQEEKVPSVSDADGDGIEDRADSDPDGDGFIDLSSQPDSDGDGIVDPYDDSDGDGLLDFFEDTDGDGQYDGQDSDKDGDGMEDWLDFDLDGDGIGYGKEDDDGDGIENAKEDTDGDGQYDWQDSDSDGNGVDDWEEILDDPYEFTCF